MNEGTPPDSRTGHTGNVQEINGQLNDYGSVDVPESANHRPLNGATPPGQQAGSPALGPAAMGSRFQEIAGTESYFQFIEFACSQMYKGLPVGELDRMDLLSAFGMLLGEYYQSKAVPLPPMGAGQAVKPNQALMQGMTPEQQTAYAKQFSQ